MTSILAAELFPASHRATVRGAADVAGVLGPLAGLAAESALYPLTGSHSPAIVWLLPVSLLAIPLAALGLPETATRALSSLSPEVDDASAATRDTLTPS